MATTMGPRLDQTAHRRGRGGRAGGGQRTLKLMMLRFAGRSLFPALSTARTTAWYFPRGSRARCEKCHFEPPFASSRTGRLHLRLLRASEPLLVRKRQRFLPTSFPTETNTRRTPPRSLGVLALFFAQPPLSRDVPLSETRPRARLSERLLTFELGARLSMQRLPPLGPLSGPPNCFVFGMRAANTSWYGEWSRLLAARLLSCVEFQNGIATTSSAAMPW